MHDLHSVKDSHEASKATKRKKVQPKWRRETVQQG